MSAVPEDPKLGYTKVIQFVLSTAFFFHVLLWRDRSGNDLEVAYQLLTLVLQFWLCILHSAGNRKGDTRGRWVVSPAGCCAAARFDCKVALVCRLVPSGPILTLSTWMDLKTLLSLCRGFFSDKEGCLSWVFAAQNANYYMLVNEWAWLSWRVRLLWLKVHFGWVLESGLRHNRKMVYMLKVVLV